MRRSFLVLLAALVCAPALIHPRTADACTCVTEPPIIWPNGVDAPLNAVVMYYGSDPPSDFLNLRTEDGFFIDTVDEVFDGGKMIAVLLHPLENLAPNTVYAVHDGPMVLATFTTGTELDSDEPALTELEHVTARHWVYGAERCVSDSCTVYGDDGLSEVVVEYDDPPEDTILLVLTLHPLDASGEGEAVNIPIVPGADPHWDGREFEYFLCSPWSPDLSYATELWAQLTAHDGSGLAAVQLSAGSVPVERCAMPPGCEIREECIPPVDGGDDIAPAEAMSDSGRADGPEPDLDAGHADDPESDLDAAEPVRVDAAESSDEDEGCSVAPYRTPKETVVFFVLALCLGVVRLGGARAVSQKG